MFIKPMVFQTTGCSSSMDHIHPCIHSLLYDWGQEAKHKHLGIVGRWTLREKKTICIVYNKIITVKSSHCTC